ncbi:MAG TPA: hypothetical protein PKL11_07885 [Anaerolineaceae bacterium]|jgi:hypothetical protein|nr:hypothetical protein [Anaerolineaceae bacterium]
MSIRHLFKLALLILLVCGLSACDNINAETEQPKINSLQDRTAIPTQTLTPHPITIGKGELMVVVEAVEKYYADHGVYPDLITDLIPGYIAQLPYTFDGHEIWYERNEYQTYEVGFDPSERKYCVYLKKDNYLECGFRNPELFITPGSPTLTPPPH